LKNKVKAMASSREFVEYVCDQLSGAGHITFRKMFGEYAVYCDGKVFGLICDNQVFIKPTAAGPRLLPDGILAPPYPGAKPYYVLEELDDREFLTALIAATCEELPVPQPKRKSVL
jgi:TfoX/Sxy family transcriptional regulator of competence genes